MKEFKASQIDRSLRRFSDYASDLNTADFNMLEDRLSKFCHFCSTDAVFSVINKQLRDLASNGFNSWLEERLNTRGGMVGSGDLVFPLEDDLRIAYMYELLFRIYESSIEFYEFAMDFFAVGSSRYDDYIYAFNQAVTEPLIRDIGYKLEEMREDIEETPDGLIPLSSIQIIHHADNVIQQIASGSNIHQNADISINPKLKELFSQLRDHAKGNEGDLEIVEAAEAEANQDNPKVSVVKALLGGLSFAASVTGIISAIVNIISG